MWQFAKSACERFRWVPFVSVSVLENLVDLLENEDVKNLPPIQLIVGDKDNLIHSNKLCYSILKERKFCESKPFDFYVYNGRHAYFGFPLSWIPHVSYTQGVVPGLYRIMDFFTLNCLVFILWILTHNYRVIVCLNFHPNYA